jgi:hypothetical protein
MRKTQIVRIKKIMRCVEIRVGAWIILINRG